MQNAAYIFQIPGPDTLIMILEFGLRLVNDYHPQKSPNLEARRPVIVKPCTQTLTAQPKHEVVHHVRVEYH